MKKGIVILLLVVGIGLSANAQTRFTVNGLSFDMVYVEGGIFTMGCTGEQSDCESDEKSNYTVSLSNYYIGKFEVTQVLWKSVIGSNPSKFRGDNLPVEQVSWEDCMDFVRALNRAIGKDQTGVFRFALPTEAEWEYAARGGRETTQAKYAGSGNLDRVAWYADNSGSMTHAVGLKTPNELGLYDMGGNVYEWCSNWYGRYSSGSQANPKGPPSGSYRVLRGGGWYSTAQGCRVSNRGGGSPGLRLDFLGFRLALVQ